MLNIKKTRVNTNDTKVAVVAPLCPILTIATIIGTIEITAPVIAAFIILLISNILSPMARGGTFITPISAVSYPIDAIGKRSANIAPSKISGVEGKIAP